MIENGIKTVKISNVPLLGTQEKNLNLWKTSIKLLSGKGGNKKSYIVTTDSPASAEVFISEYLEVNLEAAFKLIKINELDYQKVIKISDSEKERLDQNKNESVGTNLNYIQCMMTVRMMEKVIYWISKYSCTSGFFR